MDEAEKRIVIAMRPGIMTEGPGGSPDRKREEHEEGKEHARDDDVWLDVVDKHVLLCNRPRRDELDPEPAGAMPRVQSTVFTPRSGLRGR